MIHNPADRIEKMMREIRAFDPQAAHISIDNHSLVLPHGLVVCASRFKHEDRHRVVVTLVVKASKKPERCARLALKQVRKIREMA